MSREPALAETVGRTVEVLSPGALDNLIDGLRAGTRAGALPEAVATSHYRDVVGQLVVAWSSVDGVSSDALALALECAAERERRGREQGLSIVWTGPATDAVPVRRTDQALLELVRSAGERLIIVSFAVYKVADLAAALLEALGRGVNLAVVLESQAESGGKVDFDMAEALGTEVVRLATVYTWPAERRPTTPAGTRASLHAKCAVADGRRLLVSSANLTEFALSLNIELGLLVSGGEAPARVQRHLEELITRGDLRAVTSP